MDCERAIDTNLSDQEYISKSREIMEETLEVLQSDGWKLEKVTKSGDRAYSKFIDNFGKVYKVQGIINASAKLLEKEMFVNAEEVPKWLSGSVSVKRLKVLNKDTDIMYAVNRSGIFTSDRLLLRKCHCTKFSCAISARSIDYIDPSIKRTYYRISHSIDYWGIEENPKTKQSVLQGLANASCNIWFPSMVTNRVLCENLLEYVKDIRTYFQNLEN